MVRRSYAILLFAAVAGFAGLGAFAPVRGEENGFTAINPPHPAGAFVFEDEEGRTLDLRDFRGRFVLLNLWSTSCAPCAAEMPTLDALSAKLDARNFAVIALTEDHDGKILARDFFKRHNITHLAVYIDSSGRAPFVLQSRGLPTTYLIDPNGMEIARLEGAADWTQERMISYLEKRIGP